MTIHDYLRVLRERWKTLLSVLMLSVAVAGGLFVLHPRAYTAKVTTYVSAREVGPEASAYQGGLLSQQRVTSYVELVRSERVANDVIRRMGLSVSPAGLIGEITAATVQGSVLIDITVTDRSPAQAAALTNAVADALIRLVTELETPSAGTEGADVVVRTVAPAAVPTTPSTAGLPVYLTVGLLLGLGLGVAAAFLRNTLDTSVKSAEQLQEAAKVPILGMIAYDAKISMRPLTVLDDPHSPHSEAFRHLRTSLQFVQMDEPCRVVTVTSSVPSEGKTTTVCNVAVALASAGNRVLILEADLRRPRIAGMLGLEAAVGLSSVLSGQASIESAVQPWAGGQLHVMVAGPVPPNPSELLASHNMAVVIRELRTSFDYVLIDTPPLLPVTDAAALAPNTDGAIVVCRHRKTSKADVRTATDALRSIPVRVLGAVLTMVPNAAPQPYANYQAVSTKGGQTPRAQPISGPIPIVDPAETKASRASARSAPGGGQVEHGAVTRSAPGRPPTPGRTPPRSYPPTDTPPGRQPPSLRRTPDHHHR